MAITYPLSLPALDKFRSVTLRRRVVAGKQSSPFTLKRQVQLYTGERWEGEVSLVPMRGRDYADWNGLFLSLDGPVGTFLMGDPARRIPVGAMAQLPGTPLVDGGGQTGEALNVKGAPAGIARWAARGDYIQLGSGSTTRLHMVAQDAATDSAGKTTLYLRPRVKAAPGNNDPVVVRDTLGIWTLVASEHHWSVDATGLASITFAVEEPR